METEYRVILGWNPDGSGLVYKRCIMCGEYKVLATGFYTGANVCRVCSYQRNRANLEKSREVIRRAEQHRLEEEKKRKAIEETLPVIEVDSTRCKTCKSFSKIHSAYHVKQKGWCMRRAKSVYADDTCDRHQYPKRGKYQTIAEPTKWR